MDVNELAARRRDVDEFIDEDPSEFTGYRKGIGGAAETTYSLTGRLVFAARRTATVAERSPEVPELPVAEYPWVVTTYHDSERVKAKDELDAVSPTYGRRRFFVGHVVLLEDKQEALCKELG